MGDGRNKAINEVRRERGRDYWKREGGREVSGRTRSTDR